MDRRKLWSDEEKEDDEEEDDEDEDEEQDNENGGARLGLGSVGVFAPKRIEGDRPGVGSGEASRDGEEGAVLRGE